MSPLMRVTTAPTTVPICSPFWLLTVPPWLLVPVAPPVAGTEVTEAVLVEEAVLLEVPLLLVEPPAELVASGVAAAELLVLPVPEVFPVPPVAGTLLVLPPAA